MTAGSAISEIVGGPERLSTFFFFGFALAGSVSIAAAKIASMRPNHKLFRDIIMSFQK